MRTKHICRSMLAVFTTCTLLLAACTKHVPADGDTDATLQNTNLPAQTAASPAGKSQNPLNIADMDLHAFTQADNGAVYATAFDFSFRQYASDGTRVKTYDGVQDLMFLTCENGIVYACMYENKDLVAFDTASEQLRVVAPLPEHAEIKNLLVTNGMAYVLLAKSFSLTGNGSEELYEIDVQSGATARLPIDNPLAMYKSANGSLYLYTHANNTFALAEWDVKTNRLKETINMDSVGFVPAFAYENDVFLYISKDATLNRMQMPTGNATIEKERFTLSPGSVFVPYSNGTLCLENISNLNADGSINKYIGNLFHYMELSKQDSTSNPSAELPGTVTIAYEQYTTNLNAAALKQLSGIESKMIVQPSDMDVIITKLMAGDKDIDIYIAHSGMPLAKELRDKGAFVPLTDSAPVQGYLDSLFPYISDTAYTPDGDIWMLPFNLAINGLWYVPENLEAAGVSIEDLDTFDGYIQTLKVLNTTRAQTPTYGLAVPYAHYCSTQYEMTYHDYANGQFNFQTPLYTHIFETMWSGWLRYENQRHPLFPSVRDDIGDTREGPRFEYDASKVVMHLSYVADALDDIKRVSDLNRWRVLPAPRISEDAQKNVSHLRYAFVNPYSENKELAIQLLETIAQHPMETIRGDEKFMFADLAMYEGHYDMSIPAYADLHGINKNGGILMGAYPIAHEDFVDEYQHGRLTAEEAIAVKQREVEMWLHE